MKPKSQSLLLPQRPKPCHLHQQFIYNKAAHSHFFIKHFHSHHRVQHFSEFHTEFQTISSLKHSLATDQHQISSTTNSTATNNTSTNNPFALYRLSAQISKTCKKMS